MANDDRKEPSPEGPSGNNDKPKAGLSAEAVGATVGAVVGAAAARLLTSPKGTSAKMAEELKAGAKTAGAALVGTLLAGEASGTAAGLLNDTAPRSTMDAMRRAEEEEQSRADHSSDHDI